jgi:hypothetical protein
LPRPFPNLTAKVFWRTVPCKATSRLLLSAPLRKIRVLVIVTKGQSSVCTILCWTVFWKKAKQRIIRNVGIHPQDLEHRGSQSKLPQQWKLQASCTQKIIATHLLYINWQNKLYCMCSIEAYKYTAEVDVGSSIMGSDYLGPLGLGHPRNNCRRYSAPREFLVSWYFNYFNRFI